MAKVMFSYLMRICKRVGDTCCPNPPKGLGVVNILPTSNIHPYHGIIHDQATFSL